MKIQHSSLLLSLLLIVGCLKLDAQNLNDALRYSQYEYFGTARSAGVAGSLGALGADYSVISTNPAGIAWMRRSQFVVTPMFNFYSGKTQLLNGENAQVNESAASFSLASLGFVIAGRPRGGNWENVNFALGYNRLADFNRETVYRGNSQGSIMNRFTEQANSTGLDQFESGLANDAGGFLIDDNTGFYFSDFDDAPNAIVGREQIVNTSGGVNEISLAVSGNYNNQLLIGLGIGIPFVNFNEQKEYLESDINNEVPAFEDLQYDENLTTTGLGFNAKLGLVYRLNQMVRIGAAVHTPTWFSLEDNFSTAMIYSYTDGGVGNVGSANSPDGNFNYSLRTPWRFSGGLGFIFGRNGFISGELEWINYSNNHLGFRDFPEDEDIANRDISDALSSSLNLKVGGEYAYQKFRLRGGVALQQPPFSDKQDLPTFNTQYNVGLGFAGDGLFLDLAARFSKTNETYRPYLTATFPEQVFENTTNFTRIIMTLGFRF